MEDDATKKPDDYVIATGKSYSIKQFINFCVEILNIKAYWTGKGLNEKLVDYKSKKCLIRIDKKFLDHLK